MTNQVWKQSVSPWRPHQCSKSTLFTICVVTCLLVPPKLIYYGLFASFTLYVQNDSIYTAADLIKQTSPIDTFQHKNLLEHTRGIVDDRTVDIIIVAGSVNCAVNETIQGLLKFLYPKPSRIYMILPQQLVGVCRAIFDSVECVNENSIIGLNMEDIQQILGEKGGPWTKVNGQAGWYHQQLLKLVTLGSKAPSSKLCGSPMVQRWTMGTK